MAQLTQLANKQFSYLFEQNPKSNLELRIVKEIIYSGFRSRGQYVLCSIENIDLIINNINEFELSIIGIQTNIEEVLPLFTFQVEDYPSGTSAKCHVWIKNCLKPLFEKYTNVWIRFYIDIPDEEIELIIFKTGIQIV